MSRKEIISTNQYIWLLFCIITAFTSLKAPSLLIFQSGRDAWLAVIFAWFFDVLLAVVYAYMSIRFPGQNMVQYSISILGKSMGKIIGIMFPLYFLLVSSIVQRSLSMVLKIVFFPRTPVEIILIFSYLVIGYASIKGIEVIGRVSEILGPIYLLSLLLLVLFVIPDIQIEQMKPQLEHGLYPALSGTLIILSFISICIIMGMFSPICNHPENGFKAKFTAVSMGSLLIILLVIASIGIFSLPQAENMFDLSLRLIRAIHIGDFFERVEAFWFMIAIGATIICSANMIWAFSTGISQIAGLKTYKPLVFPAVLVSYVMAIVSFKSSVDLLNFAFYSYPLISVLIGTIIEMFLFFSALIMKKKG